VNACPLQSVDPNKLILSTLHCEIGQINKFNADADKWVLHCVEKLEPEQQVIRAELVEAMKSLEETKEFGKQIQIECREVKGKQKRLNSHVKSLPKRELWVIEHKRRAMEHKRELTEHAESLEAAREDAEDDVKEAKARKDVGSKAY
jgi:hypothetical protein